MAGLVAADSMYGLDADLLAAATRLEGHPDNVAAALLGGFVLCADGGAERFEVPPGLEAVLVVPHAPVRTRGGARRAARRGADGRRRLQRRPRRAARARARARRLGPRRARAATTGSTSRTARTSTRARWRSPGARRRSARSGATISGAGPDRARVVRGGRGGRPCARGSRRSARAGPTCCAVAFEPHGAAVVGASRPSPGGSARTPSRVACSTSRGAVRPTLSCVAEDERPAGDPVHAHQPARSVGAWRRSSCHRPPARARLVAARADAAAAVVVRGGRPALSFGGRARARRAARARPAGVRERGSGPSRRITGAGACRCRCPCARPVRARP